LNFDIKSTLKVVLIDCQAKSITTYNQVADELVNEFKKEEFSSGNMSCDEKNIRRRAYDALNVLTAMEIISKDKKHIRWNGYVNGDLPIAARPGVASNERERLLTQIRLKKKEISEKEAQLGDLSLLFIGLSQLLRRNGSGVVHSEQSTSLHKIFLPFVLGDL
jgi:transcription factor Dp-1